MKIIIAENSLRSLSIVPAEEKPDTRIAIYDADIMIAHVALWWKEVPTLPNESVGVIGGFFANDEESTHMILTEAEKILRQNGCSIAVGPMNGNTWRTHRFVSWSDGSPFFMLEPNTAAEYLRWWLSDGYTSLAEYSSSRVDLLELSNISAAVSERLRRNGVVTRGINVNELEQELESIHDVCLESFRENFLYVAMSRDEFTSRYKALARFISPDYVRVAECEGNVCGFVFSIPDTAAIREGREAALIVKTLAVLPIRNYAGLGSLMVEEVQAAALKNGLRTAIHALQRDDNSSRRITNRHKGSVFRKYMMLSKKL